jgi:hypothetical protein
VGDKHTNLGDTGYRPDRYGIENDRKWGHIPFFEMSRWNTGSGLWWSHFQNLVEKVNAKKIDFSFITNSNFVKCQGQPPENGITPLRSMLK